MGISMNDLGDKYHVDLKKRVYRYNELDELDYEDKQKRDIDSRMNHDDQDYGWENPYAVYDPE